MHKQTQNYAPCQYGTPSLNIAALVATAALWVRIQTSLKNTKWARYQHTLARQNNINFPPDTTQNVCVNCFWAVRVFFRCLWVKFCNWFTNMAPRVSEYSSPGWWCWWRPRRLRWPPARRRGPSRGRKPPPGRPGRKRRGRSEWRCRWWGCTYRVRWGLHKKQE